MAGTQKLQFLSGGVNYNSREDTVRTIAIALGFVAVLVSAPAQAAGADEETCRAAIREKFPCRGTHPNQPARTACVKAAMERCKAKGPSAI